MSDRYWDGGTSTDPTNVNNWSDTDGGGTPASSVPGTGDHAHFTANGNGNPCTLTANWALGELTVLVGYQSTIDLATFDLTMDDGGDVTLDGGGAGEFDLGSGSHSITNGTWDVVDQAAWDEATSTVTFNGTCTINSGSTNAFWNLTINSGTTSVSTNHMGVDNELVLGVDGILSVDASKVLYLQGTIALGDGSQLTGAGKVSIYTPAAGEGVTSFHSGATWDIATTEMFRPNAATVLAPGTYQSTLFKVWNSAAAGYTLTPSSGDYVFTGNVEFENTNAGGSLTIDNTNDPNIEIRGDVIFDEQAGAITYTKGGGILTLAGAADQAVDFGGEATEDLVINKAASAKVTLGDDLPCDAWDQQQGLLDPNGKTITTTGDMQIRSGAGMASGADLMNGCSFVVGGDFEAYGSGGDLLTFAATAGWTLTVTGTARARFVDVEHSDASGGTAVEARQSVDGQNNTAWDFLGGAGGTRPESMYFRNQFRPMMAYPN